MAQLNFIAASEGKEFRLYGEIPQLGTKICIRSNRDVNSNFTMTQSEFASNAKPLFREIFDQYKIVDIITDYEETGIQGSKIGIKLVIRAFIYIEPIEQMSSNEDCKKNTLYEDDDIKGKQF